MSAGATQIDPTARIEPSAKIGRDVTIGPYCIVGPHVEIGDGCTLESHVQLTGHTIIGARTKISPFAALGGAPQSAGYRGGPTRLIVGSDCIIREGVTMNRGSEEGGGLTEVGHHGFFMSYSHVAHDCRIGHHATFANSAALGGHCILGDHVFIGGLTAAHQFSWIGSHAMISGLSGIRADIVPFALASGVPARVHGVNVIGMRRRGFSSESIRVMRNAFRTLFLSGGTLAERIAAVEKSFGSDENVATVLAFIRAPRKRALGSGARGEAGE